MAAKLRLSTPPGSSPPATRSTKRHVFRVSSYRMWALKTPTGRSRSCNCLCMCPHRLQFQTGRAHRSIVHAKLPHVNVVCSKDVAHIGPLARENATILNALLRYAKKTVTGFQRAARTLRLTCPVFVTSNTLLNCAQASKLPIRTL